MAIQQSKIDIISGTTPLSLTDSIPNVQRFLGTLAQTTPQLLKGLFRAQSWAAKHTSPGFIVSQYTTAGGHEEISDNVASLIQRDFIEAFAYHRSGAVTESRLFTQEWDFALAEISQQVRLWQGRQDTNVPIDASRRLNKQLPNSQMIALEGADHLTTLLRSSDHVLRKQIPSEYEENCP